MCVLNRSWASLVRTGRLYDPALSPKVNQAISIHPEVCWGKLGPPGPSTWGLFGTSFTNMLHGESTLIKPSSKPLLAKGDDDHSVNEKVRLSGKKGTLLILPHVVRSHFCFLDLRKKGALVFLRVSLGHASTVLMSLSAFLLQNVSRHFG